MLFGNEGESAFWERGAILFVGVAPVGAGFANALLALCRSIALYDFGVAGLRYETLGSDRIIDESYPESATPATIREEDTARIP